MRCIKCDCILEYRNSGKPDDFCAKCFDALVF